MQIIDILSYVNSNKMNYLFNRTKGISDSRVVKFNANKWNVKDI
jgi:hypothetical protein